MTQQRLIKPDYLTNKEYLSYLYGLKRAMCTKSSKNSLDAKKRVQEAIDKYELKT